MVLSGQTRNNRSFEDEAVIVISTGNNIYFSWISEQSYSNSTESSTNMNDGSYRKKVDLIEKARG